MDNENQSIHEFDLNLICEYFSRLERQGPGSPEMTIKGSSASEKVALDAQIDLFFYTIFLFYFNDLLPLNQYLTMKEKKSLP